MRQKDYELTSMDLQLFAGDDDLNDDVNDDVDNKQDDVQEDGNDDSELDENPESVEPEEDEIDHEKNAHFKKLREKAEAAAAKKLEAEKAKIDEERRIINQQRQEIEAANTERRIRDEMLTDERIWKKAEEEGVSEEVARKMLLADVKAVVESEKAKVKQRFEAIENQKKVLKSQKYFNELEHEIDAMITANPNIDPWTAFHHLRSLKLDELEKKNNSNVVKSTLADVQDRMKRRSVPSGGASGSEVIEPSKILSKEELDMCKRFGSDPREIAKYVQSNKKRR